MFQNHCITHRAEECRTCHLLGDNDRIMRRFKLPEFHPSLSRFWKIQTNLLRPLLPQEPLLWYSLLQANGLDEPQIIQEE